VKSVTPQGRVIACLEGGYDLQALADSMLTICGSLFDFPTQVEEDDVNSAISTPINDRVERAIKVQSKYWEL
jgi:acetoin utilization deacetylase AcuC-like enzyme